MDLSIIIVNYRAWKRLRACLDSLSVFTGSFFSYEVIIVDNASDDGILDGFKSDYAKFIFIRNKFNGGFANGCNLGGSVANGRYFLFLNPDTIVKEEEIERLLSRARENPGNYLSSCRQVNEKGKESKAFGIFPGFGTLTGSGRAIYKILLPGKTMDKTKAKENLITPDWVSGSVI